MTAKILVVDDLVANLRLLQAKLRAEYYVTITAQDGLSAIKVAEEEQPDVILLDVMMPEMDGFEACKKLKSSVNTMHIPIIMVTALQDVSDRIQGLEAGADDFLTKPINDTALFARIRSVLRLKTTFDELRLRGKTKSELVNVIDDSTLQYINEFSNARVTLIDEDSVRSKQVAKHLKSIVSQVDVFNDPKTAIDSSDLVKESDLIISDMFFSDKDINGLHIFSELQGNHSCKSIPFLLLVDEVEGNNDFMVKAFEIGVSDYIVTPIDYNELLARSKSQIKRKRYQDALRTSVDETMELSLVDQLTGSYNRRYFDTHIKNIIAHCVNQNKPVSVMIIDIDFFKKVNDTYGHQVGDQVLKQVRDLIFASVRITDLLVRFGGEEFAVILSDTTIADAATVGERVRAAVEEGILKTGSGDLKKTISIGAAEMNKGETLESLIGRADENLYKAKETGRNKVIAN